MLNQLPLHQVINSLGRGIVIVDPWGSIMAANQTALKILDLAESKAVGSGIAEIMPAATPVFEEALATGMPCPGRRITDNSLDLILDALVIRGQDEKIHGVTCTFQPLHELEQYADQLKSYEHLNLQLNSIFELSSDGLWLSDGQGMVLRINRASEKLCGVKAGEIVGKNIRNAINTGLIDVSATLKVLETRQRVNMLQNVPRTGKQLLLTGTPLFDDQGEITLVVVNERDITQLNMIKDQLQQSLMISEKFKNELAELSMRELMEERIVAESREMKHVLNMAQKLAHVDASNILVLGESGTGKGLVAKYIHNQSTRRDKPFIQINCAALPENLLEAELFGYERGAFTGARENGKAGLFELAHEGTLFLDEIGEAPVSSQAKLLKYLDDHVVQRLGGTKPRTIDCTIIAATNQDLEGRTMTGAFRKDLFYRLNTFTIHIPPLRERPDDVFELATFFLGTYNQRYDLNRRLSPDALLLLQNQPFPGNVRELRSLIKKTVVMSENDLIDGRFMKNLGKAPDTRAAIQDTSVKPGSLNEELALVESKRLAQALQCCRNTREMAEFLGISQPTVVRKLKKHGLLAPRFINASKHD